MNEYLDYHTTPLVEIKVGGASGPAHTFGIHRGLLVAKSDYFKSALHDHWVSKAANEVYLPHDSIQTYSGFARWIYSELDIVPNDFIHSARAYVLGDKLLAPMFKTAIYDKMERDMIDTILQHWRKVGDETAEESEFRQPIPMELIVEVANIVYEGTAEGKSDMRELLANYAGARMYKKPHCAECGTPDTDEWITSGRLWSSEAITMLVRLGIEDFVCDVFHAVAETCAANPDDP